MPSVVQFRRGTTAQNDSFTGAEGELSVDTSLKTLRLHDGTTAGGAELLRKDVSNLVETITNVGAGATAIDTLDINTYRSAKYVIDVRDISNSEYQTCELNVIHNGANAYVASYGVIFTGASARMSFTANVSGNTLTLYGTGVSSNNTVKLIKFQLPV